MKYTYSSSDLNKAQPSGGNATQGKIGYPTEKRGHGAEFWTGLGIGAATVIVLIVVLLWLVVRSVNEDARLADDAVQDSLPQPQRAQF